MRALNTVMLYNPGETVVSNRVLIGEEMFKIDEKEVPNLFKTAWNEAVSTGNYKYTFSTYVFNNNLIVCIR